MTDFQPGDQVLVIRGRVGRPSWHLAGLRCKVLKRPPEATGLHPREYYLQPLSARRDTGNYNPFYYPGDALERLPASRDSETIEAWLHT